MPTKDISLWNTFYRLWKNMGIVWFYTQYQQNYGVTGTADDAALDLALGLPFVASY